MKRYLNHPEPKLKKKNKMATGTIDYIVYGILITVAVVFIWWKFSMPLIKFWELIKGAFSSGKDRSVQTFQTGKEIVYDI